MIDINWGVMGAGDVCERKGGPPLYGVDGCRLAGVTRRNRALGEEFARRHGQGRYFDSVASLLAEPDINAIYVATPPDLHAEHTVAAAEAGKHVLCEKPMAVNARECLQMIDACNAAGVTLAVAYYRRCYPSVLRAKALLEQGRLGQLESIRINDQFPPSHRLDLVHFFAGSIASIAMRERPLAVGSHSDAGAVLTAISRTGVRAEMNIGWRETGSVETVELVGSEATVLIDDLKGGSLVVRSAGGEQHESFEPLSATHWGLVENFSRHLNGAEPLACDGEEGRRSSVILDFVSATPHDGREVTIDYDHPPEMARLKADGLGLLE